MGVGERELGGVGGVGDGDVMGGGDMHPNYCRIRVKEGGAC